LIKISVSVLDAFNKYINEHQKLSGDLIYPDGDSFLEYFDKEFKQTVDMQYGSAVDAIIENPEKYWSPEHQEYIYDGIAFPNDYINSISQFFDYSFPFQVNGSTIFKIGDTEVLLSARVDQLHGMEVVEFKTVWSSYLYEKFAKSMQWKCYNIIFETPRTKYIVAVSKRSAGGEVKLKQIHQFYLYHSEENLLEVSQLLSQLVDFLKSKNRLNEMEIKYDRSKSKETA
jgi:hypothetical protein